MNRSFACIPLAIAIAIATASCHSVGPATASNHASPSKAASHASSGAALLDAVKSLEGSWSMTRPGGQAQEVDFHVTSGGSVVRELMSPGGAYEMVNMYHLDGDELVVTHYCAGGNQPRMRATSMDGDRIEFRRDSVTGLDSAAEVYMGEMTLELIDHDHFAESWRAFAGNVVQPDRETHFDFTRR